MLPKPTAEPIAARMKTAWPVHCSRGRLGPVDAEEPVVAIEHLATWGDRGRYLLDSRYSWPPVATTDYGVSRAARVPLPRRNGRPAPHGRLARSRRVRGRQGGRPHRRSIRRYAA